MSKEIKTEVAVRQQTLEVLKILFNEVYNFDVTTLLSNPAIADGVIDVLKLDGNYSFDQELELMSQSLAVWVMNNELFLVHDNLGYDALVIKNRALNKKQGNSWLKFSYEEEKGKASWAICDINLLPSEVRLTTDRSTQNVIKTYNENGYEVKREYTSLTVREEQIFDVLRAKLHGNIEILVDRAVDGNNEELVRVSFLHGEGLATSFVLNGFDSKGVMVIPDSINEFLLDTLNKKGRCSKQALSAHVFEEAPKIIELWRKELENKKTKMRVEN